MDGTALFFILATLDGNDLVIPARNFSSDQRTFFARRNHDDGHCRSGIDLRSSGLSSFWAFSLAHKQSGIVCRDGGGAVCVFSPELSTRDCESLSVGRISLGS